jgi:hypothetical protein
VKSTPRVDDRGDETGDAVVMQLLIWLLAIPSVLVGMMFLLSGLFVDIMDPSDNPPPAEHEEMVRATPQPTAVR